MIKQVQQTSTGEYFLLLCNKRGEVVSIKLDNSIEAHFMIKFFDLNLDLISSKVGGSIFWI